MILTFQKATEADIPLIGRLADTIWRQHYPSIISIAQIDYMLDKMYSPASIAEQMKAKQHYTLIYANGIAVGYYSVSERTPRCFYLHKFYVDIQKHRQGIGAAAFEHMLTNDCKGYEEIRLQVNRRNVKAINFYFKQGFVIDFAEDFDFGSGYTMDDFVMKLSSI